MQLLWEDLLTFPGLLWKWLVYGVWSTAHSRLASGDARVSYGAALMALESPPTADLEELTCVLVQTLTCLTSVCWQSHQANLRRVLLPKP